MGSVEEINDTNVLLIQAFFSKASEVQDQAAQIEHEQASFSIEILSLECRIRALEEYYFASASTLGKRSRGSCQAITVDTQTEKRGQAIDCSSDQHHTHVATNSAHIPLSIPAAEFNPKGSSEALLPASPRRNYVHFLLESTLESPPKTNGQSMQIPQQDVITPPAHDVSTMIDVVPEPGASESLSSANVDLERVWAIDSTNPSEAGSDPELELQYPSDADLELELELSRMAPNVSSSEPNICLGCKRTFSCQDALTVSSPCTSRCDISLMISPVSRDT
ncbi:hypothetical protein FIBSPDRAFT_494921 [Athelia psychrophila]|uniref:Uncharacterized protein n=1 Tax=Athelia psychrophila TaxID=1759441 RepID=A0A166KIE6_9AGAM|nr:hypothetical protein FIBSPDRAFT_494921 [Fibularhizoctonia sp. CBS 109695]